MFILAETEAGTSMVSPFSEDEYRKGVATLKNNKAAGRDDVLVEQVKNLGPNAHKWLFAMLNNCFIDNKIPTINNKMYARRARIFFCNKNAI